MMLILNAALYQAGWLACLFGAARGAPWAGPLAAVAIVGWHLARARQPLQELRLLLVTACIGIAIETAFVQLQWVRYPADSWPQDLAPLWMVALWMLFATTLNVSLRALRERPLIAAALGAIGAPAAYYAGARIGALEFLSMGTALAAIGIAWAAATPVLFKLARRFDGYARP